MINNKMYNEPQKEMKIFDDENNECYNTPLAYIHHDEFHHLHGTGFFDAIKKIFPVIGIASNLVGKVFGKKQPEPQPQEEDDMQGGFLSSLLPLVMQSLPGVISGFKDLFSGNGLHKHSNECYGLTHNNVHYINPIELSNHIIDSATPANILRDKSYRIELQNGGKIDYSKKVKSALNKNQLHLYKHIIDKISGHGIGVGIGRGFQTKEIYDDKFKNVGEL